jgi:hypothetical protein
MPARSAGFSQKVGARKKILFGTIALVGFLAGAEVVGWSLQRFTRLGELSAANPVVTLDDPEEMYPRIIDDVIEVATEITRVEVRDVSGSEGREDRVWMEQPPEEEVAVIVGGSTPLGMGLKNRDTFWWMLDEVDDSDIHYLNVASAGDDSREIRSQIARVVGFGVRPRLVVIYTGENEWNGFRYPRLSVPDVGRLDSIMLRSKAYSSLRTLTRALAQSSVYEDVEAVRRNSNFSLTRFPLDTRYRNFDHETRDFVDESRIRLLARFEANIEAVVVFARAHGAEVVMVTNPIRYHLSPAHYIAQVASEGHAGTAVEKDLVVHLETAVDALLASDLALAEGALQAAYELDPESSLTNHYLGYFLEANGDAARARLHFMTARDRIIGAGGLLLQINQTIRDVAVRHGVGLVDLELVFSRHSDVHGNGLADDLIADWCHPNPEGARLIFEAPRGEVADALQRKKATK